MIVDASVIVAVILKEEGYADLLRAMQSAPDLKTGAIAVFEAMAAVAKRKAISPQIALADVQEFITAANMAVQPVSMVTTALATEAFERYGKGRGHPAQLNMGDCFAYAAARELGVRLLYKGDDFAATDLA